MKVRRIWYGAMRIPMASIDFAPACRWTHHAHGPLSKSGAAFASASRSLAASDGGLRFMFPNVRLDPTGGESLEKE